MNELIESIIAAIDPWRRARLAAAAVAFRAAIDPEVSSNWGGHNLHKALIQAFPAHKKAVVEFRHYLRGKDRLRLEQAWGNYHGGSEENPDFFVMYCVPANGPELLKQRLEALRGAGKHT